MPVVYKYLKKMYKVNQYSKPVTLIITVTEIITPGDQQVFHAV